LTSGVHCFAAGPRPPAGLLSSPRCTRWRAASTSPAKVSPGLYDTIEARGIALEDDCADAALRDGGTHYAQRELAVLTGDTTPLLPRRDGALPLLTAEEEVELATLRSHRK
jgi:hypothetical protein